MTIMQIMGGRTGNGEDSVYLAHGSIVSLNCIADHICWLFCQNTRAMYQIGFSFHDRDICPAASSTLGTSEPAGRYIPLSTVDACLNIVRVAPESRQMYSVMAVLTPRPTRSRCLDPA